MPFATVNGLKLHYEIQGSGPKLLFIHGISADLKSPISLFTTPMTKHFTILAFDPRGLGESDDSAASYTMADMASDAAGLAAAVGWDTYHVFGASMGGMVAQELVLQHPASVQKLILGVTNAGGKHAGPAIAESMFHLPTAEMLYYGDTRQDAAWMAANPEMVKLIEQNYRKTAEAMQADPRLAKGIGYQAKAVLQHDTYDRLPRITAPTLVFAGRYDGGNPYQAAQAMAEQIPGARFELLESGHGTWYSDPGAWEMMINFLEE